MQYQIISKKDHFPLYIIEAILKNEAIEDFVLDYHLSRKGWKIDDRYCIMNIHHEQGNTLTEVQEATLLQKLQGVFPDSMCQSYENCIIIILHNNNTPLVESHNFSDFQNLLVQNELRCIVSPDFYSFQNLKYSYIQTKYLLQLRGFQNQQQRIFYFKNYFDKILLSVLKQNASLKSLCHPRLLDLKSTNKITIDTLNMLKTYLLNGRNTLSTAKKLQIHRNTLSYRLEKIEEQLDIRLSELDDMQAFWLLITCYILSL